MTLLYSASYITHPANVTEDAHITDLARVEVSHLAPVRIPKGYRGQRHMGGRYLFSRTGELVLFESRLEQDALRFLDHDRSVTHVAAQPFMLKFRYEGSNYLHYPDFLVERRGRPRLLLNIRTQAYLHTRQATRAFSAATALADALGWEYQTWSEAENVLNLNLRFLGGFRFAPYRFEELFPRLLSACTSPLRLDTLSQTTRPEALARPVIFHLLWTQVLQADLTRPLGNHTLLTRSLPA